MSLFERAARHSRPRSRRLLGPLVAAFVVSALVLVGQPGSDASGGGRWTVTPVGADLRFQALDRTAGRAADPTRAAATTEIVEPGRGPADPTRPVVRVDQPEPRALTTLARGGTAVFLGDSYTSGWAGAGIGGRGWPRIVSSAMGWRTVNLAVAGTGFLNPGWTGQPIRTRVGDAIAARPDVVVLAAGHNDSRWSSAATAAEAERVIDRLHAALPDAVLVIVAPIWQDGSPPARCLALRDRLRAKAAALDAVFIDPLAEAWFAGPRHRFILADGIHPSDAGHRHMASRVLAGLSGAD
jgi:lysophospholipase L1-like esterase